MLSKDRLAAKDQQRIRLCDLTCCADNVFELASFHRFWGVLGYSLNLVENDKDSDACQALIRVLTWVGSALEEAIAVFPEVAALQERHDALEALRERLEEPLF